MKKRLGISMLCIGIIVWLLMVYIVGGKTAAYAWNLEVFILAPISTIVTCVELIVCIVRLCKKKSIVWNGLFIIVTFVISIPVGVILGISPMIYPTYTCKEEAIQVTEPVKNAEYVGGPSHTPHAIWPSECFAYDIVREPKDVGSAVLSDYGIWEAEVWAPISGTVIGKEEKEKDITPNTEEFTSSLGNYVFIEMENGKGYIILAHFKEESIEVEVGDKIVEGQFLGLVGNSGTTSEPHIHFQCQKENPLEMKFPTCATGVPIKVMGDAFDDKISVIVN